MRRSFYRCGVAAHLLPFVLRRPGRTTKRGRPYTSIPGGFGAAYAAAEGGYFKCNGRDVELDYFGPGSKNVQGIVGGSSTRAGLSAVSTRTEP